MVPVIKLLSSIFWRHRKISGFVLLMSLLHRTARYSLRIGMIPGVGGHQVGDVDRGRIYRVAPPKSDYKISKIDVTSIDGAITALTNPNSSNRFLGWNALAAAGEKAEGALQKLWTSR